MYINMFYICTMAITSLSITAYIYPLPSPQLRISDLERDLEETKASLHELQVGRRVSASKRAVSTGRRSRSAAMATTTTGSRTGGRGGGGGTSTRIWDDSIQDAGMGLVMLKKYIRYVRIKSIV